VLDYIERILESVGTDAVRPEEHVDAIASNGKASQNTDTHNDDDNNDMDTGRAGPVERALSLLTCFATRNGLSLTELAQQAHLAPSTTSRLLKVLEQRDFVRRGSDRLYYLGAQIVQLGIIAVRDLSLQEVVHPHLQALAATTGESVHLGILTGDAVLYIDQVSSQRTVQATSWLGRTVPLADTAIGAAILGQLGPAGYSATRHTIEPDISSVAAPIYDRHNRIIAAINIIGPTYRISDDTLAHMGIQVVTHTRQISQQLGSSIATNGQL
jgi:DNA-binding IclR family transcriptional regulator